MQTTTFNRKTFSGLIAGLLLFSAACNDPETTATEKGKQTTTAMLATDCQSIGELKVKTTIVSDSKAKHISTVTNEDYKDIVFTKTVVSDSDEVQYSLQLNIFKGLGKQNLVLPKGAKMDVIATLNNSHELKFGASSVVIGKDPVSLSATLMLTNQQAMQVKEAGIKLIAFDDNMYILPKEKIEAYKKAFEAVYNCK